MTNDRPTRLQILSLLKKQGQMTSKQVGDIIGVTSMGARQHLTSMEKDGLVSSQFIRQKAGRPALYFSLTNKSDTMFPQRYGSLAMDILKGIEKLEGREKIEEIFLERRDHMQIEYNAAINENGLTNGTFKEKIEKLAEIQNDDGFMTEIQQKDQDFLLVEHNCPIQNIVKEYGEVCQHELELFKKVLNTSIERIEHIAKGERSCIFKIMANGSCKCSESDDLSVS